MPDSRSNRLSLYMYWCCIVLMCFASFFFYPRWKQSGTEAAISWDVSGYYWYLPSAFIYHDIKHQGFKDSILNKYRPTNTEFMQGMKLDNGNYVMKYASGMAVMYLPFFTAAHLVAGALGYPRDGFSAPYQFAIQFGGLFMALIGLWYFRKLLLIFYNDKVVAIVLLLLVFGSNYLNYSSIDCGMSHSWLFTVYVFLLLNTIYFYRSFEVKYAIRIGLLAGLATLTRPTDIISCLIPLLWGMDNLLPATIKKQCLILVRNYKALLLAVVCALCVLSIQLIYWKYVSGHWLVYSYQGQKLYFRSPNFMDYTFSYRSGWLVYSPLLILAFIGIIPFLWKGHNKVAIITFFLLNYYIVCAWNIWWYGGRAMIQSYPVLFFCIAALVNAVLSRKALAWLCVLPALFFIYYNSWITYIYHKGDLFDNDCMSEAYFWRIAGKWSAPSGIAVLKDNPDLFEGQPKNINTIYHNDFDTATGPFYDTLPGINGKVLALNKNNQVSPYYKFAFTGNQATWLRAQATFHCDEKEYEGWKMAQFIVRLIKKDSVIKERMIRVYRLLDNNQTRNISIDMKLPGVSFDSVHVFFWNGGSDKPLWIYNLEVKAFTE